MLGHFRWTVIVAILTVGAFFSPQAGADSAAGSIHLCDRQRTGYRSEPLTPPYHLDWVHAARHKPRPAWREPKWEIQRIDFDYAYPVSAGNGMAYYGSSADHAVHALDLSTGQEAWTFFTGAPVRLAPAVRGEWIYASSDDGFIYCLNGKNGDLRWKFRPDVPDEWLIGNDQMMSRWPARSGVLVDGDRLYTTFGMWSPEGIFVFCLDADTGSVLWRNDTSGTRFETHPHFRGMGGVSPTGYLALAGDVLVVPNGRATPALFDAKTGEIIYHEAEGLFPGGAWTMTHDDLVFVPCPVLKKPNPVRHGGGEAPISDEACLVALRAGTGEEVFHLRRALQGVIDDEGLMTLFGPDGLISIELDKVLQAARNMKRRVIRNSIGHFVPSREHRRWQTSTGRIYSIVRADDTVIAGGQGWLRCFDANTGKKTWGTEVDGDVRDLLMVDDAVLASTTEGTIYCFRAGRESDGPPETIAPETRKPDLPDDLSKRASELLSAADVREGYCLALGNTDLSFLAALADESELTIYHSAAGEKVAEKRRALNEAGLYGTRIALHERDSNSLPYAGYFANLVLLNVPTADTLESIPAAEAYRVLRPCGGVMMVQFPDGLWPRVRRWLESAEVPKDEWARVASGVRVERGPLPGAGEWTHQYADPGRTAASEDTRVRLPLRVLWFGGMGPAPVVSRHYRTPAPLVVNGRVFVPGTDRLVAMDAYNGRVLWQREMPEVGHWPAAHRGGSIAADHDAVYALQGKRCLRLDPHTGKTLHTYRAPIEEKDDELIWEYLAVVDDTLVGTVGDPNVQRKWWSQAVPANRLIFAMDKETGEIRWQYEPQHDIASTAIAIEDGRMFLIVGRPRFHFMRRRKGVVEEPPERTLLALDMESGDELWRTSKIDVDQSELWVNDGVVVATLTSDTHAEFRRGRFEMPKPTGTRASAYSAETGEMLWKTNRVGQCTPVIVGDVIYFPYAYNLHTGEPIETEDPLTGRPVQVAPNLMKACSKYAGCSTMLMSRSGCLGFYDLERMSGLYQYPYVRASCWINMIPAGGMVVVPEGSSSCPCAYSFKTSLALVPDRRENRWGVYGRMPETRRWKGASRLRVNFGAPGDRPDEDGDLWFSYPRPASPGPDGAGGMGNPRNTNLPIDDLDGRNLSRFNHNPDWRTVEYTDRPWLYTYGWNGPCRLRFGLASDEPKTYHVTLYFCEPEKPREPRTFDVRLNGKTVIRGLNVLKESGGPNRALTKELTVQADGSLTLELVKRGNGPAPIISAVRILQEE